MREFVTSLGRMALLFSLLFASACGGGEEAQELIPGDSLAKANRSLAMRTLETSAALALATDPSCSKYELINTEIISVIEPLQIVGVGADEGNWVEKWTYDICGASVPITIEYDVDELGTSYRSSIGGLTPS